MAALSLSGRAGDRAGFGDAEPSGFARGSAPTALLVQRREHMRPVIVEQQRLHPAHGREGQRAIEMGKQLAAARGFPFQSAAQFLGDNRNQDEVQHSGKVFRRRAGNLGGGREMDVAISEIDRRAAELAVELGLRPLRRLADLVVDRCHGRPENATSG
jgi:hypothetical protein